MLLSKISGKRIAAAMLAACLTPYLAGAPAHAAGEEIAWPKRLIVSAPSSGTPASMIMASIARVIEKNTPIQRVIVQPIGGINNFAPMMEKGEVDIAIHSGADVLAHMAGLEENRMSFMRTLLPTSVQAFVVLTTPEDHDRRIAYTSQLPHVLAAAYVNSPTCPMHVGYSAGSYLDVSRVARINENLWPELFIQNRDALVVEIDFLIQNLTRMRQDVASKDQDALTAALRNSRLRKETYG